MKTPWVLLIGLLMFCQVNAQFSQAARDSIQALTQADYKLMLEQLGIEPSELRRGPSGNPADPNAANTEESRAKTYKSLPDALVLNNGDTVRTASQWEEGSPQKSDYLCRL